MVMLLLLFWDGFMDGKVFRNYYENGLTSYDLYTGGDINGICLFELLFD